MEFDLSSSLTIQQGLDALNKKNEDVGQCVARKVLFALKAAYYALATEADGTNSHFALNFENYTHFTSPIRRYADIIVHRQLESTLANSQPLTVSYINLHALD